MKRTHFAITDSTQTQAKKHIEELEPFTWLLYTADEQSAGHGQYNRRWASPPHVNIYATYLFTIPTEKSFLLIHLPQVATVAVSKTLEDLGFRPQIKWINDVMLDFKKMCGILCESITNVKNQDYRAILCGIGLNVNMSEEICKSLDQPVTSLLVETGRQHDKEAILRRLSHHLYLAVEQLFTQGFAPFQHELNRRLTFLGERITIEQTNPTVYLEGIFEQIDEWGRMVLRTDSNQLLTLDNGRILRGHEAPN